MPDKGWIRRDAGGRWGRPGNHFAYDERRELCVVGGDVAKDGVPDFFEKQELDRHALLAWVIT